MSRSLVVILGALLAILVGGQAGAQANRIGVVDVQKVLVRSAAGLAAREQLEKEKASMQREVDQRQGEIEKLREELEKKALLLSPEVKKEREETLQRRVRDLRRLVDDFQKDLDKKEQEITQRILQEVAKLIERHGKEKGYLLILEKRSAGVIHADGDADLTDEVIKLYDQEKAREKK